MVSEGGVSQHLAASVVTNLMMAPFVMMAITILTHTFSLK